jgi:hypothetical protein
VSNDSITFADIYTISANVILGKLFSGTTYKAAAGWYFNTLCSYKNYNRSLTSGTRGDSVTFTYTGSGFAVIGSIEEAAIKVVIDERLQMLPLPVILPETGKQTTLIIIWNQENIP